ncbi:hypothetical protein TA3x_002047 [Tundrisphaera sp. TA3]|uniref:hypothetical protein n=1 Tax=Tundrisphaera sp. TA3 TaxID=3435775 RepID=UPI003EC12607
MFHAMGSVLAAAAIGLGAPPEDAPLPSAKPDRPADAKASDLGFLQVGRAYLIRFPEERHPALKRETETAAATTKETDVKTGEVRTRSVQPITWNMKFQIDVFVVRELGGGPWVLLEYPADPKVALQAGMARHTLADSKRVAEMEKTEEGREALASVRESADRKLETTRTWVNMNYAVSIADPPKDGAFDWTPQIRVEMRQASPPASP